MAQDDNYYKNVLGVEKPTDMEIGLYVLRILSSSPKTNGSEGQDILREANIRLAENALKTMSNPFGKKLLMDGINRS